MTPLEQARLLLNYHCGGDTKTKAMIWKEINPEHEYNEANVSLFLDQILDGRTLTEYECNLLSIIGNPPPPSDGAWADRITSTPEGADVKWLAVNLLTEIGYTASANAISRHA